MSYFSAELVPMVELYQRETTGLMEEFDAKLTKAMQENRFSAQDINAVFRVVHTVKSSAAMMGLAEISTCTHRMEDLFLLFRDQPARAAGQENRIFDLMYLFSDYLEKETARVSQDDFQPAGADGLLAAIQKEIDFFGARETEAPPAAEAPAEAAPAAAAQKQAPAAPAAGQTPAAAASAEPGDETVWRVTLQPGCQMENVRAFMLVHQLEPLCAGIATEPADLEAPDAAAQIARDGLVLRLRTAHGDEAARRLSASPYVLRVENPQQDGAPASETPAQPALSDEQNAADADAAPNRQSKFSMVSWEHVMRLQNITGELITANTIMGASLNRAGKTAALENEFQNTSRLFRELEKLVAAISMMPVSAAMPQYYRLVRDVAAKEEKQIRLKVTGAELEVDKNLLDTLASPLIHLLRNAADHGIETPAERAAAGKEPCGTIELRFENLTDHLRVTVSDDGCGIDPQRILKKAAARGLLTRSEEQNSTKEILDFVFLPGFSLNEQTNQYSGRGVGMDVALNVVTGLGGNVNLSSELGKGSSIQMELPVSVTSAECIKFMVGPHTCLLPIRSVDRICSTDEAKDRIQSIEGRMWFQADAMLPVLDLFRLFGEPAQEDRRLILIRDGQSSAVLLTGPVTGQQTAVEKPLPSLLGRNYRRNTGIIGCTVTETGRLGMMLNADWLIRICGNGAAQQDGN